MATIQDLAEMALEELAKADRDGLIPNQIKFHRSGDAVKPWSHMGDYDDHGNFCGSLTMFLLLFPSEYGLIEEGNFKLLDCLNGCGDREEPLRFEGKIYQKSGKGQNNYRTNLLEALLAYIVVPDGMKKYLGLLWLHVLVSVIEISDAEPSCWEWSQERWIKYMLAAKSDQQVTADENKVFAVKTCKHLQLVPGGQTPGARGSTQLFCSHHTPKSFEKSFTPRTLPFFAASSNLVGFTRMTRGERR